MPQLHIEDRTFELLEVNTFNNPQRQLLSIGGLQSYQGSINYGGNIEIKIRHSQYFYDWIQQCSGDFPSNSYKKDLTINTGSSEFRFNGCFITRMDSNSVYGGLDTLSLTINYDYQDRQQQTPLIYQEQPVFEHVSPPLQVERKEKKSKVIEEIKVEIFEDNLGTMKRLLDLE